jgi:glutamine amidotransferase
MIAIIQGGGANLASVQFALDRLGKKSTITTDPTIIQSASHVILPGVASAEPVMNALKKLKLIELIKNLTQPVLGICLGMQLLYEFSEEGNVDCLGILPGKITRLTQYPGLPVPHMGWNQVDFSERESPLFREIPNHSDVYFVHSFARVLDSYTIANTTYGQTFSAAMRIRNFWGVQFHPERSGKIGELILKNFVSLS